MAAGSRGRVLSAEEAAACERWTAPSVDGAPVTPRAPRALTAAQLEALQREAWQEAYAAGRAAGEERGYAEGRAHAEAELAPLRTRCRELLEVLAAPLDALDEELEQALVRVALAVARQIVLREIRTDRALVVSAVREALAALPASARTVRVRVHPEDLAQVREALAVDAAEARVTVVEDHTLAPGGCRVLSEESRLDASVEARLEAAAAQVLGGGADGEEEAG